MQRLIVVLFLGCFSWGGILAQEHKKAQGKPTDIDIADSSSNHYNIQIKTQSLGLGGLVLKDEYLSPLNYGGLSLVYTQETSRLGYSYPQGDNLIRKLVAVPQREPNRTKLKQRDFVFSLGRTYNPAGNAAIYRLQGRLSGSSQYRVIDQEWGRLYMGPGYTIGLGGLYSSRNGNNPATMKFDCSLSLALNYSYRLPWRKFPAIVRASSRTDLLGLQWEQQFGESYYELYYLSKDIAKRFSFAHIGRAWGQELKLSLDIPIWDKVIYTLSYRYHHKSWSMNSLQNIFNEHSVTLGLTRFVQPLGGRAWLNKAQTALPF